MMIICSISIFVKESVDMIALMVMETGTTTMFPVSDGH